MRSIASLLLSSGLALMAVWVARIVTVPPCTCVLGYEDARERFGDNYDDPADCYRHGDMIYHWEQEEFFQPDQEPAVKNPALEV